MHKEDKLTS